MAYTPTEWETGDVITAEKLNNIEDGIVANEEAIADAFVAPEVTAADQGKVLTVDSSGEWAAAAPDDSLIVTLTYAGAPDDSPVLSVTVDELYAAVSAHKAVQLYAVDSTGTLPNALLAIQSYMETTIPDVGSVKAIAAAAIVALTVEPVSFTWLSVAISTMGISVAVAVQS